MWVQGSQGGEVPACLSACCLPRVEALPTLRGPVCSLLQLPAFEPPVWSWQWVGWTTT